MNTQTKSSEPALSEIVESFPCPTCGELRSIKFSKKEKPYFVCDPCGVQVFIRGKEGIKRLCDIKQNPHLNEKLAELNIFDSARIRQIRSELDLLNKELVRISESGVADIFNSEINQRKAAVRSKIERLEAKNRDLLSGLTNSFI